MSRAGFILIQEKKIALIERHRIGMHYFVIPGGQVEKGETLHQTIEREAQEELGLIVSVKKLIATVIFQDKPQYYFLVDPIGGNFGQGNGPEMVGLYPPENGTYQATWMHSQDLFTNDIRPAQLMPIIENGINGIWPDNEIKFIEKS